MHSQTQITNGTSNQGCQLNTKTNCQNDSGVYLIQFSNWRCKGHESNLIFLPFAEERSEIEIVRNNSVVNTVSPSVNLFSIHGNISYDYFYRSRIDTPFNQQDFKQHTERVSLNILIKEKYPLQIGFISRQSNSGFFMDFTDVNLNFDRYAYSKTFKQEIINKLKTKNYNYKSLDLLNAEAQLKTCKTEITQIKSWLENPMTLQKIVEKKEKYYYQKLKDKEDSTRVKIVDRNEVYAPDKISTKSKSDSSISSTLQHLSIKKDTIINIAKDRIDSSAEHYTAYFDGQKQLLDSLNKKMLSLKHKVDSISESEQKTLAKLKKKIYSSTNNKELKRLAIQNGIDSNKQNQFEKYFAAIKSFGVGKCNLDYTELTVQNTSITGVNLEYNPSIYAAFAVGKIDYRFRNFYNRSIGNNNQYIVMGRFGIGDRDKKALIFTYFTGRKSNNYNWYNDSNNNNNNLMGYSIEAVYRIDENTFLSAEFAKSTKQNFGNLDTSKGTKDLFVFNDKSNMGFNLKAQKNIPESHTRFDLFLRKTGKSFQSFSLVSQNTEQTAWQIRVDQGFVKDRITLTGILRRDDFTNPFSDKTYKTSIIFKSVLLNVRFRKLPVLSLGYYPSTQLFLINNEKIRESAFYILNGSMSYSYVMKGLLMNSIIFCNKYINEATDSGFISYKGLNYYVSHLIRLKKINLQGGYAFTKQSQLCYYTLDASGDYLLNKWLTAGVGIKYNHVKDGNVYYGEMIQVRADFKKLGSLQLQYDKSFLPTIYQQLAPVDIGRLTYYKQF